MEGELGTPRKGCQLPLGKILRPSRIKPLKLYQRFIDSRGTRFVSYRILLPSYFVSAGSFEDVSFTLGLAALMLGRLALLYRGRNHARNPRVDSRQLLANVFEPQQSAPATSPPDGPSESKEDKPEVANTSGTGFLVSDRGHILTNHRIDLVQYHYHQGSPWSYGPT
jgi:hypothetical protein